MVFNLTDGPEPEPEAEHGIYHFKLGRILTHSEASGTQQEAKISFSKLFGNRLVLNDYGIGHFSAPDPLIGKGYNYDGLDVDIEKNDDGLSVYSDDKLLCTLKKET